jgi:LmbE family N-acetylglucosaminyl deacetylase
MKKKLFGFSFKRMGKLLLGLFVVALLLYWWQPYQLDILPRRPPHPLPVIPPATIGLVAKGNRVLVITAHPDDEAFFCAGTLMQLKHAGAITRIVVCTNGDKGYYPWFLVEPNLAQRRQAELRDASSRYGALPPVFLNLRDGRLHANQELVDMLAEQIRAFKPDHIMCFDSDYPPRMSHGDHRASGAAAKKAMEQVGFQGWVLRFQTSSPNTYIDVEEHWDEAQAALAAHASQYDYRLDTVRNAATAYAEEAGERFGPGLAEAFRADKMGR